MENTHHLHTQSQHDKSSSKTHDHTNNMYKRFIIMAILMFIAMYVLMFAMVDRFENVIPNINNLYMTLLMVAVMLLIEIWIMKAMYTNKKWNIVIVSISLLIGVISWFGIREQLAVNDEDFVKGMIPHHGAAVLMSEKAHLTDPELIQLQKNILETQAQEIEFMNRKLKEIQEK